MTVIRVISRNNIDPKSILASDIRRLAEDTTTLNIKMMEKWLSDPEWPRFGPGIVGPGGFDAGRIAARAAIKQCIDIMKEDMIK